MDFEQPSNPYESPQCLQTSAAQAETKPEFSYQKAKRRQLLGMIVTFAVSGFVSGIIVDDRVLSRLADVAAAIAFAFFVLRWCDYDHGERQERQERLWQGLPWRYFTPLMLLCPGPPIMVPVYLLATRGLRGFISIAWALAFFALLVAVGIVAEVVGDLEFLSSLTDLLQSP
jgi:hypothetical protein